jgi:WhiB family redox-sensing transcriptional regulator
MSPEAYSHPIYKFSDIELNPSTKTNPSSDWTDSAACMDVDPDHFFSETAKSIQDAKQICSTCVVRVDCLDYALENEEQFGIWGGLTHRERKRLQRNQSTLNRFATYLGVGKAKAAQPLSLPEEAAIAPKDVVGERFPVSMMVNIDELPPVSSFELDFFNKSERFWL